MSSRTTGRRSTRARRAIPTIASAIKRKRIEEPFGWINPVGGLRKIRYRGRGLVEWFLVLTAAAYNLVFRRCWQPHSLCGLPGLAQVFMDRRVHSEHLKLLREVARSVCQQVPVRVHPFLSAPTNILYF